MQILGQLKPGTTQHHLVSLPGAALANDEPRPVVTVSGSAAGPVLFVNAGLHGAEYPAVEAVIRLANTLDPRAIAGTVVLMPVLNLPAFWARTPFVCPVDDVNPNRVFPGDPNGSYSEQMTHALMNQFVSHADAYIDLHGGDIPEALVPFCICRGGDEPVDAQARQLAIAFGLPYVLAVTNPVQPGKGSSSYVASAERDVPAVLAEAGGAGRLDEQAVQLLVNGVKRVMQHLGMLAKDATNPPVSTPKLLTAFEWLYSKDKGVWYPRIQAGDHIEAGQKIGEVRNLFGRTVDTIIAPVTGEVLFLTINPAVQANGLLMGIGTAEQSKKP